MTSDNVELVATVPVATPATSMAFSPDSPHVFVSTRKGIEVYDISTPELPLLVATEPMVIDQNENPTTVAGIETPTRTHTITCINPECTYAYSDGRTQGEISIVDLRNWREPRIAGTHRSVVNLGHDADYDDAGVVWHVGGEGSVGLDVSTPEEPVELNSTDERAVVGNSEWNRFIHHNSQRPFADRFDARPARATPPGHARRGDKPPPRPFSRDDTPSVYNGNVLLVTEEFILTNAATCPTGDGEGAFQTWHIPWLDAERYAEINPGLEHGGGTITPLDRWQTELLDSGITLRQPGFCSAHYFDFHPARVVAIAFYEQGTRILDVRDAEDIKQVGYFFTPDQETFEARWVPEYDGDGRQTGSPTNIVYTTDHVRGMDVLRVDLDSLPASEDTENQRAPILPQWLAPNPALEQRASPDYGYACRLT